MHLTGITGPQVRLLPEGLVLHFSQSLLVRYKKCICIYIYIYIYMTVVVFLSLNEKLYYAFTLYLYGIEHCLCFVNQKLKLYI